MLIPCPQGYLEGTRTADGWQQGDKLGPLILSLLQADTKAKKLQGYTTVAVREETWGR